MSDDARKLVIRSAGIGIILIALGAMLLPGAEGAPARQVIGWMLVIAGAVELAAAAVRWAHRPTEALAATATTLAGLRLLFDPGAGFFEVLNLIILWLLVRAAALGFSAFRDQGALGAWMALAAAVDFLLAIALLAGLPVAFLVVGLFGPTGPISATFAWVIAISFIANGVFLLATAALDGRNTTVSESADLQN